MPSKVNSGFVKADSGNLPKIFMFMVLCSFKPFISHIRIYRKRKENLSGVLVVEL